MATRLLWNLQEEGLQLLIAALETRGGDFGECIPMEQRQVSVPHWGTSVQPHVILMMAFRWKEFPRPSNSPPLLRQLTCCSTDHNPHRLCVNPYHWSIQLSSESSPKHSFVYSNKQPEQQPISDDNSSNFVSQAMGGTEEHYQQNGHPWCKIRYWEGRERKGSPYSVLPAVINVLGETPYGSGLSLAAFFGGPTLDHKITETRQKICQGLVLWQEDEAVWVYNRSEAPVYLNSATLDGSLYDLSLYKCPPGYAMIIYYYDTARQLMSQESYNNDPLVEQADVNSVRISFAKGWGNNYHRREILCCPCWLEVHLLPTFKAPPR